MDSATLETLIQLVTSILEKLNDNTETIGTSDVVTQLELLNDNVTCTNQLLAFVVLLLIVGWLYGFLKDIFNQC